MNFRLNKLLIILTILLAGAWPQSALAQRGIAPSPAASGGQAERLALVIGNSAYRIGPLRNPVNDARVVARELRRVGFRVLLGLNLNRTDIERSIITFSRELTRGSVGLFYFSGHGVEVNGNNYLIPIGMRIRHPDEIRVEAVDVQYVLARMGITDNALNIVILDACRDNPFTARFRSVGKGFRAMSAPKGTLIAYATSPGSTAADGPGKLGLYTEALVRFMGRAGLPIETVFKRTRVEVIKRSRGRQTPWESSSLTGDFYFVASGHYPPPAIAQTGGTAPAEQPAQPSAATARFQRGSDGVIHDHGTGLQWYVGPQSDMSFEAARQWVKGLDVSGGGWRIPNPKELESLYVMQGAKHAMPAMFGNSGRVVWSNAETGHQGEYFVYFISQFDTDLAGISDGGPTGARVFAVRGKIQETK